MLVYLYLIKFEDGSETVAIGQDDHRNESAVEEIFCSELQWVEDGQTTDDIISLVKSHMEDNPNDDPTKRIIN